MTIREIKQKLFTTALQHVVQQGVASVDGPDGSCVYRGQGDTMCAFGPMIKDYSPSLEGSSVITLMTEHAGRLQDWLMDGLHSHDQVREVADLGDDIQTAHDVAFSRSAYTGDGGPTFIERFKMRMEEIAKEHHLDFVEKDPFDAQRVFDTVLEHVRAQGKPSTEELDSGRFVCRYLTETGEKCAIGSLMVKYAPEMEGMPVASIESLHRADCLHGWARPDDGDGWDLLASLQYAHDTHANRQPGEFMKGFEDDMRGFARMYKLEYAPPAWEGLPECIAPARGTAYAQVLSTSPGLAAPVAIREVRHYGETIEAFIKRLDHQSVLDFRDGEIKTNRFHYFIR